MSLLEVKIFQVRVTQFRVEDLVLLALMCIMRRVLGQKKAKKKRGMPFSPG